VSSNSERWLGSATASRTCCLNTASGAEGEQFRARAEAAQHLLSAGFARQDLNDVGGQFPTGPWWLNPKALDSGSPREPWQEEVATLHAEASTTATDLRAVATLTDL
jgi:hypothetical protein